MKKLTIVFMVLMLTAVTINAFGQQKPATVQSGGQYDDGMNGANPGRPGRNGPLTEENREAVRKKIEVVRIWRLTDALRLDTNTSAKLSSLLSSFDQQRRSVQRQQMMTMRTLRLAIQSPKPDESSIRTALEALEKNHLAMQELRNNEMSGLKNILTFEQQARYVVFQQEFMSEMRGMIHGARSYGYGGDGVGPGGGQMRGGGPGRSPDK